MTTEIELQYFFDPFCGWCYASAPALAGLADQFSDRLRMLPSGLFVGGRPISSIADHAWRNDQRIQALTGQRFSREYHQNVLLAPNGIFDSGPATFALTALGEHAATLEPRFLHAIQIARYVEGRDTSNVHEVATVAVQVAAVHGIDLTAEIFAERLRNDPDLRARALERVEDAQRRMDMLGIRGVPQLVALINGQAHVLSSEALYQGPARLVAALDELSADA
ncbi:protein-disulfide isomerase [Rhizobium sp. MC63]|uniref:Protein-disulfide isomerase n=1 Tax=Rhizobium mulingense TaxID=3031128 RepID=A0ACC6N3T8_9HYPH|nr:MULTISPECIES: protein-disulfide isomerase [unclassified Rhizobium]MDF0698707.1 protein-disulfide isomerase [Rhizobium sp. MC63]MEA3520303.1 protein-disulfide isomerase [Rhizobium sp. MJ31]